MGDTSGFDAVSLGQVSIAEGRQIIAQAFGDGTVDDLAARRIYAALRAWTWKAINGQRRDEELRGWYDLMRRVTAGLTDGHPQVADKMTVLYELLYESISVTEVLHEDEQLKRFAEPGIRGDLLRFLAIHGESVDRAHIHDALKNYSPVHLDRYLTIAQTCCLVDRTVAEAGMELFDITRKGRKLLTDLSPPPVKPAVGPDGLPLTVH